MKTKYRVVKKYGECFFPQVKGILFWGPIDATRRCWPTLEMALIEIEEHKRIFSKDSKRAEVVWEESNE